MDKPRPETASAGTAELPPELAPKRRGRPPGSVSKPKPAADAGELSPRTLAAAWQGLWLVTRFLAWLFAGRANSPIAVATGATWTLDELTADEADEDARVLLPLARELPTRVLVWLSYVGGPVLLAKRIASKLRMKGKIHETPPLPSPETGPQGQAA